MKITLWQEFALLLCVVFLCAGEVRAQSCKASPPITPVEGWCTPSHTPPALGDHVCAQLPEQAAIAWAKLFIHVDNRGVLSGSCVLGESGGAYCTIIHPSDNSQSTLALEPGCRAGSVRHGSQCISQVVKFDDEAALARGEQRLRDLRGNLMLVVSGADTAASLGDYDSFGRPGSYDNGLEVVNIGWPENGTAVPDSFTSDGWTMKLTWQGACDDARLTGVVSTTQSGTRISDTIAYYPDGHVHTITEQRGSGTFVSTYNEDGHVVSSVASIPVHTPQTAVVTEPKTSAAVPTPAPVDSRLFFRPQVQVPQGPQGIGARLLGPLSLLLPPFEYLAQQMGLAALNIAAAVSAEESAACDRQLIDDYNACRDVFRKAGLVTHPDDWPGEPKTQLMQCESSARERHRYCQRGERPPTLRIPFIGLTRWRPACESQLASDRRRCRAGAVAQFGGPQNILYYAHLTTCMGSARARYTTCNDTGALNTPQLIGGI